MITRLLFIVITISSLLSWTSGTTTLTHFFVFGDRYSGVNYLTNVLSKNFAPHLQECTSLRKEGTPNHDSSAAEDTSWRYGFFGARDIRQLECNPNETLFILIVKEPHAWLASVAERKYQSSRLVRMHIDDLVHSRWEDTLDLNGAIPRAKKKFKNLLDQRTAKIRRHHAFLSKVQHSALVRYEDLLEDLVGTLKRLLRGRGVVTGNKAIADVTVAGASSRPFKKRNFYVDKEFINVFNSKAVRAIEKRLDKQLEANIGYRIPPNGPWRIEEAQRRTRMRGGIFRRIWRFLMGILWWIVVPTLVVLAILTPVVLWIGKWDKPQEPSLAKEEMWVEATDPSTGHPYYYHKQTHEVRWDRPVASEDGVEYNYNSKDIVIRDTNKGSFHQSDAIRRRRGYRYSDSELSAHQYVF